MNRMYLFSIIVIFFSSCATLSNYTGVVLYDCPRDVKVKDNGIPIEIKDVSFSTTQRAMYYTSGIYLKRTKDDHVITLTTNNKSVDVILKSKFDSEALIIDLFLGLGVGIWVDLIKGPLRTTNPKYIDVAYHLGLVEIERSESTLKRMSKKAAREY